jgi:peptidyl-prolyl cis-trans isomerase B (cyclophilin B)
MEDGRGHSRSVALAILISVALAALAAGIVGCGGSGSSSTTAASSTGSDSTTDTSASGHNPKPVANTSDCKHVKPSKTKSASYSAPEQVVKKGERLTAVVRTSCGTFEIRLNVKRFPTTVNSFVFLAEKNFYDGLGFERAAYGTYVEGGKPTGGTSGPGYSVEGEIPTSFIYRHTVVAMSQSGEGAPGHAGSRFFVIVAKPWLDYSGVYAPLGTVEKGLDVLERVSELGPPSAGPHNVGVTGQIGKLKRPVLIEAVTIKRD